MRRIPFETLAIFGVLISLGGPGHAASPPAVSLRPLTGVVRYVLPAVDREALLREDALAEGRKDVPLRLGLPMTASLSPATSGTWEDLPGGGRVWRLVVHSQGARWIVLGFDHFALQPGGALEVYDPQRTMTFGPATSADVREHGQLWFPPIPGDTAVVELHWPAALAGQTPALHLGTVSHGYKDWYEIGTLPGDDRLAPDGSGSCNIDVNCALGATWQDQKRGVVRLLSGGSSFCSASLVTNAAQDCKNYILTAAHCTAGASTTFQFNYERPSCGSGTAPTQYQLTGAFVRANSSSSDFTLLEMDDAIPENFGVFYNGWTNSTTPGTEAIVIHHPGGDVKKISYSSDPMVLDSACGGSTHWRVDDYEQGTTEPGSSGSPLFDQNHRIVGQLHCGPASCTTISYDAYGRFDLSWTGGGTAATRLRDWLDPGGTGAVVQDGIDASFCLIPQPKLTFVSRLIDDGAGDADGIAEPSETLTVPVTLINEGTLGASSVAGQLSTLTPLVMIADVGATWPDIPSTGSQVSNAPHFVLALDPAFPCGSTIALHLDLSAAEAPSSWSADFTIPTGTASVSTSFEDTMESGTNGWVASTVSGSNPWTQVTTDSTSPTHSWKVIDIGTVSESILQSPAIPSLPPSSVLRFMHRFNLESDSTAYDGGVLEYSAGAGPWTDAGPLIVQGAYTGTLSTGHANPLGGRQAWSGNSGGWIATRVNLASLAGSTVQLRWRFGTDSSVTDEGWYVDDVTIEVTSFDCSTALALPGEASALSGAPLMLAKDPGGYLLTWSAPPSGGAAAEYRLYRSPLVAGGPWTPVCEGDLGASTSAVLATLTDDQALIVVAANAAGEGPYGKDSEEVERVAAAGGDVCP